MRTLTDEDVAAIAILLKQRRRTGEGSRRERALPDAMAHEILTRLDRIEAAIAGTRKSVAEQAREMGVHPTTLWRRREKAKLAMIAAGRRPL